MPAWTMPGDSDHEVMLKIARGVIPRDLGSEEHPAEQLHAFAAQAAAVMAVGRQWARGLHLGTAAGPWVDLHASDRGSSRQGGEGDEELVARLRVPPDAATLPAITETVNHVLTAAGISGSANFIAVPVTSGAFAGTASTPRSFSARGDRTWRTGRGHLVVIVPQGTGEGTAASVASAVEAKRTASSTSHVETETT